MTEARLGKPRSWSVSVNSISEGSRIRKTRFEQGKRANASTMVDTRQVLVDHALLSPIHSTLTPHENYSHYHRTVYVHSMSSPKHFTSSSMRRPTAHHPAIEARNAMGYRSLLRHRRVDPVFSEAIKQCLRRSWHNGRRDHGEPVAGPKTNEEEGA